MNTAPLDLNLLQTFDAVHAARSVSRAAERLGVSQPIVSHALASVEKAVLLHKRYVVLARAGHPLARRPASAATLRALDYALVRSHSATARALTALGLSDRVRLTLPHLLVLPRIRAETDLAVLVPANLAQVFHPQSQCVVWRPRGLPPFDVSVHWYWRYEGDPGNRWLRGLVASLFAQS